MMKEITLLVDSLISSWLAKGATSFMGLASEVIDSKGNSS